MYLLLKDIVHFYFTIYTPGFNPSLITPSFALGGLAFSPDESENVKRGVYEYQYHTSSINYTIPFSNEKRERYFEETIRNTDGKIIPATRRWEVLAEQNVIPSDSDRPTVEHFNSALGLARTLDRPLVREVANTELALVRHILYLRRLMLRYIKTLIMFIWTAMISFVLIPFLQDDKMPTFFVMASGYFVWSLFAMPVLRLPMRWIYCHRQAMPDRTHIDQREAKMERQVLATNIDGALVVQGLDRDFNLMCLKRFLVQLAACNIQPMVILNKADLVEYHALYTSEIKKLQRDCLVYFCSTYTGTGLDELRTYVLERYKTYILIGSSGVGKSSLLNALMNTHLQEVNTMIDFNNKGKHTTTSRDLFQLPNGSLVIDTPGMREFGLTYEEGAHEELFPAIQKFAANCRFSDCKHLNEMGCAVLEAVNSEELEPKVYESYLKLIKEERRFELSAEDKKRLNKQWGKMTREAKDYRSKYKY